MRIQRWQFGLMVGVLGAVALAGGGSIHPPGASAPTVVVPPLPLPGPNAVACSNVVRDFSRVPAGEDATSELLERKSLDSAHCPPGTRAAFSAYDRSQDGSGANSILLQDKI